MAKAKKSIKKNTPAKKAKPAAKAAKKAAPAKSASKKPAPKAAVNKSAATAAVKKSAAKKSAKPAAKGAKVIKLPLKKAAKPAPAPKTTPAKGSHLKLVVDNKKKSDWSKILTPLDDRILVLIDDSRERVTAGGLIIPDTAEVEGNNRGLVVSVGPGHRDKKGHFRPLELKVGDQVLFGQYSGTEIELESQNFKILRETDVLGLVTK